MIKLSKFSGEEFWVNPDTIKYVEDGGDTIVYLTTGERLLVQEPADSIRQMFMEYKKEITIGITQ